MYPNILKSSLMAIEEQREGNIALTPERLRPEEKEDLLSHYHPGYNRQFFDTLKVGENRGSIVPKELCDLLHARSVIDPDGIDLRTVAYDVDVLVIGGGGAGAAAAIEARNRNANVMIVTKLRFGDSNTVMAEGGMQVAEQVGDSPAKHFLDAYGGGHFAADRALLCKLVSEGADALEWLCHLGVSFDRDQDGNMSTTHGGGTSYKRVHAAGDYTGLEIMRTLRHEVKCQKIPVLEYTAAVELLLDSFGNIGGAVLLELESQQLFCVRAKTVILATGGAGRLHYQGFPTSNHYGATADGLVMAYRAGARLIQADSFQYHPTGAVYPIQVLGDLVTEKVRALGAQLLNRKGNPFVNSLETRDVTTAAIIRECQCGNGVSFGDSPGVWLDIPMIEKIHGNGTVEKRLPSLFRKFSSAGIDIRIEPILVYPTLHYQNGGLEIDLNAMTCIDGLYAAGEVTGGIHGKNRLMGNALLDIIVFGRSAGKNAAEYSTGRSLGDLSLDHLKRFHKENSSLDCCNEHCSPVLFPDYRNK